MSAETSGSYQPLMPGGESLAVQLARVRQEWATQAQSLSEQLKLRLAAESALEVAEQERDEALSAFGVAEALRLKTVAERDKAANTVGWLQAQNTVLLEERDTLRAELAETFRKAGHLRQERDQLSVAVAGWAARFHAAYEALYIEEFDGDSCPDLESTIAYAVSAYRRVCESEAKAADQISLLRAELVSARTELARLRVDLKDERATLAQVVADYAEAADELERTIPTSKEKTT